MTMTVTHPLAAIDAGTSAIRVAFAYEQPRQRPTVVSGGDAGDSIVPPLMRQGVVNNVPGFASVLSTMLKTGAEAPRPLVAVGIPSDASISEQHALVGAVTRAGATVGALVAEPLAAAVGAGLDITAESPLAVVDLGEGVSDVALIQASTVVGSSALRKGSGDLRRALRDWFATRHGFPVDGPTAESLVHACCASTDAVAWKVALRDGRRRINVRVDDVAGVIDPILEEIASFVVHSLQRFGTPLPPILLTGGASNLTRLTDRIASQIGTVPPRSPNPEHDVVRGIREMVRTRGLLAGFESALEWTPTS